MAVYFTAKLFSCISPVFYVDRHVAVERGDERFRNAMLELGARRAAAAACLMVFSLALVVVSLIAAICADNSAFKHHRTLNTVELFLCLIPSIGSLCIVFSVVMELMIWEHCNSAQIHRYTSKPRLGTEMDLACENDDYDDAGR
jgi:hypothetical protein